MGCNAINTFRKSEYRVRDRQRPGALRVLQTAQLSTENAQLKSQLASLEARLTADGL